jgi:hypothetical protein
MTTDVLEPLLALQKAISEEAYDDVVQQCKALKDLPNVSDELRETINETHAKALLWMEDYSSVVPLFKKNDSVKAYALYRQQNYALAASSCSESEDGLGQHVLAQSLHRSSDTKAAVQKYSTMIANKTNSRQERMELLTNAMAVLSSNVTPVPITQSPDSDAAVLSAAQTHVQGTKDDYPYDLAYNLATYNILTGRPGGPALLQTALANAPDEDEAAPIAANLAWSAHLSTTVADYPNSSGQVETIVQLNRATKLTSMLPVDRIDKLTPLQRRLYYYNRAVLAVKAKRFDVSKESCQALLASLGGTKHKVAVIPTRDKTDEHWWKANVTVVDAHVLCLQGKRTDAIHLLEQRLATLREQPLCDIIDHAVTTVLLHLGTIEDGGAKAQLTTLQLLPTSMQSKPGVVATMAHLYQQLGDESKSQELLSSDPAALIHYYMSEGKYDQACKLLEPQTDVKSRVQYVEALAYMGQITKAAAIWSELQLDAETAPKTTWNGQDLELAPLPKTKSTKQVVPAVLKKSHESVLRRRAKRREQYLASTTHPRPKDAERWIPTYERSGRKNRRGYNHKGSQGGANERDAAKLDVAARKDGAGNSGPSTANMVVAGNDKRVGGRKKR